MSHEHPTANSYPSPYVPKSKPYVRNGEVVADTIFPEGMQRVALAVEYDGFRYHGFQTQVHDLNTIQRALEKALSIVADETITVVCAGRTDAGVHATNQIVHFDTLSKRAVKAWTMGTRQHLPEDIRIHWAQNTVPQFHARFSAKSRTYRYLLSDASSPPAISHRHIAWTHRQQNVERMQEAANFLLGEHDFTSFRATQCQAKNPVRTLQKLNITRHGHLIMLEFQANGFLHHMVRNIVGVLKVIAQGDKPTEWVVELIAAKDRTLAAKTAEPHGLYFVAAEYSPEFQMPEFSFGPFI